MLMGWIIFFIHWSHTYTLVQDCNDDENIQIYITAAAQNISAMQSE